MSLTGDSPDVEEAIRFKQDMIQFNHQYTEAMQFDNEARRSRLEDEETVTETHPTNEAKAVLRILIAIGLLIMFAFGLYMYINPEDDAEKRTGLILWVIPVSLWSLDILLMCCGCTCFLCMYAANND